MPNSYRVFISEFWRNFHSTGSIAPSSRWLARALTRFVPTTQDCGARKILEVGPGTGAVTGELVRRLAPNDSLTLVELNDQFVEHLRNRFEGEEHFRQVADRSQIVHDRLENLPAGTQYDLIISGLPLNNFDVSTVVEILATLERFLSPGGRLSFFEYVAVRKARGLVSGPVERTRLKGIGEALDQTCRRHEHSRECVLSNLPPAWVHHLRKSPDAAVV